MGITAVVIVYVFVYVHVCLSWVLCQRMMVSLPMGIGVAISDVAGSHAYLSRPMRSGVDMYNDCRGGHIIMLPVTVY